MTITVGILKNLIKINELIAIADFVKSLIVSVPKRIIEPAIAPIAAAVTPSIKDIML